jgi:hypothetical protein
MKDPGDSANCPGAWSDWLESNVPIVQFGDPRLPERFWNKVYVAPSGCWMWIGAVAGKGFYGTLVQPDTRPKKAIRAHRLSYETFVGPIAVGLEIDHLCRTHRCVNPLHLQAVTRRENKLRGISPVAMHARQLICQNGHPFSPENTYINPKQPNRRACRKCGCARDARWRAKQHP